jgi:hypothetical protein
VRVAKTPFAVDHLLGLLASLLVPEQDWQLLEADLQAEVEKFFPAPRPNDFEVHASEIINPRGFFRTFPIKHRLDFFHSWMALAEKHNLKVIYRAIAKKRYARWLLESFGSGVIINPHIAAFLLVAQVLNEYLRSLPGSPLGILISDENKDVMFDVEKSIRLLRGDQGGLRLSQIIEKGFFIRSDKSLPLQLCDLCAFCLRRLEEQKAGVPVKPLDQNCIPWVKPLIHRGAEPLGDVLTWLKQQQNKEAARDIVAGTDKVRTSLVAGNNVEQSPQESK